MKDLYKHIVSEGILSDIDTSIDKMDVDASQARVYKWIEDNITPGNRPSITVYEDGSISFITLTIYNNDNITEIPDFITYHRYMNDMKPTIYIHNCKNFKSLGKLFPFVHSIRIVDCPKFEGFQSCTKLHRILSDCTITRCDDFQLTDDIPDCRILEINECPKVKDLSGIRRREVHTLCLRKVNVTNVNDIPWECQKLILYSLPKLNSMTYLPPGLEELYCSNLKIKPGEILRDNEEFRKTLTTSKGKFLYNENCIFKSLNVGTQQYDFFYKRKLICTGDGKLPEKTK